MHTTTLHFPHWPVILQWATCVVCIAWASMCSWLHTFTAVRAEQIISSAWSAVELILASFVYMVQYKMKPYVVKWSQWLSSVLKTTEKKCVFSLRLKTRRELALRMTAGRLFQMAVAGCLKAQDDKMVWGLVRVKKIESARSQITCWLMCNSLSVLTMIYVESTMVLLVKTIGIAGN